MHDISYKVSVACLCNENLIKSLEEVKSFFSFELVNVDPTDFKVGKYNALIIESNLEKKFLLGQNDIPKIYLEKKNGKKGSKNPFEIFLKLPVSITQFNQTVIELCKKYEFSKNSQIKIKDYILDKNERVLKKGEKSLKITEKEIYFIEMLHLHKQPLSKNFILRNVWSYSPGTDTHTVETHIYRLRQKIKDNFGDKSFIRNNEKGYLL